jgi:hypothetical protein
MKKIFIVTMLSLSVNLSAQTPTPVHQNIFVSAECTGEINGIKTKA